MLAAAIAAMSAITAANAVEVLNASDIMEPYSAPATLKGAVYDGGSGLGIVELKLGKVNEKNKTSKISGSVIGLDGKKHAIKAFVAMGVDGTSPKQASLEVKGLGTMSVTIGGGRFAGLLGGVHVQSASAGGNWTKTDSVVHVAVPDADLAKFAGTVVKDLLPDDEPVILSGGKWKFNKAAGVKWAKIKPGVEPFGGFVDAESGKGLVVETYNGVNKSGMKLVYTPKNGTFKGSYKVYALEGSGAKTKLKKYTINVSGVVVDGIGYGVATCKKPSIAWAVRVGAQGDVQEQTGGAQGETGGGQEQTTHQGVQLWENGPYWAKTNIGAEDPWDYGYYFWWGDTIGYKWENGQLMAIDGSPSNFSFEYVNAPTYGKDIATLQSGGWITANNVLELEHDAAHVHWGGKWRMPTRQEMEDLFAKCDWSPTTMNGVNGFIYRGKDDYVSASIFLPCAGTIDSITLHDAGTIGSYWLSIPCSDSFIKSWPLLITTDPNILFSDDGVIRYLGLSVRPVQSATE